MFSLPSQQLLTVTPENIQAALRSITPQQVQTILSTLEKDGNLVDVCPTSQTSAQPGSNCNWEGWVLGGLGGGGGRLCPE